MGELLAGHYQIIRPLGSGGFGHTFLAEDMHLPSHPRCVIKQLKPKKKDKASLQTARRLFDTEAQALYQLGNHDQIPRLLAHFEENREFYLAQEFIEGNSLSQELTQTPWPEDKVITLLQDILEVLAFVHQKKVIHRDIKPCNLIRRRSDGKMVLIDFGAVKQVRIQADKPSDKTDITVAVGTPGYMPNEQMAGTPHYSSDVYAVGIIGIQALTGVHPKRLNLNPRTSEIDWQSLAVGVSPQLAAVIDHMVLYDFRDRYQTAKETLEALQTCLYSPQTSVRQPLETPQLVSVPSTEEQHLLPTKPQSPNLPQEVPPATVRENRPAKTQPQYPTPNSTIKTVAAVLVSIIATFVLTRTFLPPQVITETLYKFIYRNNPSEVNPTGNRLQNPTTTKTPSAEGSPTPTNPSEVTMIESPVAELLSEAERLRLTEQYQEAIVAYDEVLSRNPNIAEAHWGRCYSFNMLKLFPEAIAACDDALALRPDYAKALSSKGYAFEYSDRHQEAKQLFEQAIAVEPNFAEAANNRGTQLLEDGELTAALSEFEQATNADANFADAWANRGVALWRLGRYEDAIQSIDEAIHLQPDNQNALNLRQQIQEKLEQQAD